MFGGSWSSTKLFIMQNNTDNTNGDAFLTLENVWFFLFFMKSRCAHVILGKKLQADQSLSSSENIFIEIPILKLVSMIIM